MSIKGFRVKQGTDEHVEKYDYWSLENNTGVTQSANIMVSSGNASEYPSVDNFPNRSIIRILSTANISNKPFPSCTIITTTYSKTNTTPHGGSIQIAIDGQGLVAIRTHNGTTWGTWYKISDDIDAVNARIDKETTKSTNISVNANNASSYPDVNNFPNRSIISVLSTANISNKPFTSFTVITTGFSKTNAAPYGGSIQIATDGAGGLAVRSYSGSGWRSWAYFKDSSYYDDILNAIDTRINKETTKSTNISVSSSNSSTYPDVNDFPNRSIIYVTSSANILNKPFVSFTVITTGFNKTDTAPYGGSMQIAIDGNGSVAIRIHNGTSWSLWQYSDHTYKANPSNYIEVINEAVKFKNSIVILSSGTYQLFDSVHNEEYWKLNRPATRYCGINLSNGIKLIGEGRVHFNANYFGSDEDIKENFSVLNIKGSCEVHNIDIEGTNICYLIHDDSPIAGSTENSAIIHGCTLVHNGSDHTFTSGAPMCIGAGESDNTYREYTDNIISSTYDRSVNAHTKSGGKGKYVITGNYFIAGTLGFTAFGNGTGHIDALLRGNSLPSAIVDRSSGGVTMYQINNTVRT